MQRELVLTDNQLPQDVIRAIENGRKIEAIKILQDATGLGLANAKVLVDRVYRDRGPKKPIQTFKDETHGTGKWLASLVAAMVLATVYFYYLGI